MAMATNVGGDWESSGWRRAVWGAAAALLSLPLIAMQFTRAVDWSPADFAVMGALLFSACGAFELAARTTTDRAHRGGAAVALLAAFLMIWVHLAVGIVGGTGDPANLPFAGVLATALIGAAIARFAAHGMARAMAATALAQMLAGAVALAGFTAAGAETRAVLALSVVMTLLWLASAWLFRRAAR